MLAASVAVLAACAKPATDTAADVAAIRATNTTFSTAYAAGDVDAVASHYAEDAVMSPPGTPAMIGRAAIREYFAKDIAATKEAGITLVFAENSDIGVVGDLGWESGSVAVIDKSGAAIDHAKYLTVYRKTDGRWLLLRDMYNTDSPPAAMAPPAPTP
jgi:uncharacterized protein (TIGR02246 family)